VGPRGTDTAVWLMGGTRASRDGRIATEFQRHMAHKRLSRFALGAYFERRDLLAGPNCTVHVLITEMNLIGQTNRRNLHKFQPFS
jgi:hypothetical protein